MNKLSVLMITKNAEELLSKSLKSISEIANEIIIVDANSTDSTRKIADRYNARIIMTNSINLGDQRQIGFKNVNNEWILVLDADEIVSDKLRIEIKSVLQKPNNNTNGYEIPYQNHYLKRPLHQGGESYSVLRLFKKSKASIKPALVHEHFIVQGKIDHLTNKIYHYSYRSLSQIYIKFTKYALRAARQKASDGESVTIRKLTLYPSHMFWARYFEDKGYKDGLFRIPLDLGFAYMEFLTYFFMIFVKKKL